MDILTSSWAVRFTHTGQRSLVQSSNKDGVGYAAFWTPLTYALLYVASDGAGGFTVQKRIATNIHFETVARDLPTPEAAQDILLACAGRLRPSPTWWQELPARQAQAAPLAA